MKLLFLYAFIFLFQLVGYTQISSNQQKEIDDNLAQADAAARKQDVVTQAQCINKVAYIYWEAGGQEQAINYFQKSIELNKQTGNQNAIKSIYNSIGMIYTDMQEHAKALDYFEKSFEIRRLINDKADLASGLMNVALSLENLGRHKEALIRLNKALDIAKEMNNVRMIRSVYGRMAQDYKQIGEPEKSFECMTLYASFNSHINDQEKQQLQTETNQKVQQASNQVQQTTEKLLTTAEQLKHTKQNLEEVEQISRERQMEIDLLSKDKLIAELKIRDQEQQLLFERKIRTVLITAFLIAMGLLTVIYILYRKFKQQGNALKQSEAKFESLFQDSPDAFIIFDGQKIMNANEAAVRLFDYQDPNQLIDKTPENFFSVLQPNKIESKQCLQDNMKIANENGFVRFEMLLKKQTGIDFFAELSMTRILYLNQVVYYVIFRNIDSLHRDYIELGQYRERLEQTIAEKTQSAVNQSDVLGTISVLKSVFITNIITSFKRPLLQLSPLVQLIAQHGDLTEKQREDLRLFNSSVGDLTKAHENITEIARKLSFQQQLSVLRFDIYKLLCDIESHSELDFKNKGILFKINKSVDFPDEITTDFKVLERIIQILMRNTIQLVADGEIVFELQRADKQLRFEIRNTSSVLSDKIKNSLFDYSKANELRTIEFLLCQQLVALLGGTISVESKEVLGTRFVFTIAEKIA